jgi:hypothetical protein
MAPTRHEDLALYVARAAYLTGGTLDCSSVFTADRRVRLGIARWMLGGQVTAPAIYMGRAWLTYRGTFLADVVRS